MNLLKLFKRKKYDICEGLIDFDALPYKTLPALSGGGRTPLEKFAIVYAVYFQHGDFSKFYKQLERYDKLDNETKQKFELIIVDDCSKVPLTLPKLNLNITLLRILKDIPWNSCGARNLGACWCNDSKILFSDIDHFIPKETIEFCHTAELSDKQIVVFDRNHIGNNISVHPNIFMMNKKTFMKYNGYDEDFAGFYGDDLFFRKYLIANEIEYIHSKNLIFNYEKNGFQEHKLSRSLSKAGKVLKKKKLNHSHKMLRFPWVFVEEQFAV
ncbi:MAG: glycosyltransferase family 2 protein, partial [Candidatus Gastranaerophilales bacterium]|nr:glycosyltransferase family 2 protein [Candidatus Gastranaerophilales bacterium]